MAIAAVRNNNPGNVSLPIQGWKGGGTIVGITGQSGYAKFPDMQTGYKALQARVDNYIDAKGLTTIRKMNSRYAEHGGWAAGVSKASGIGIDTPLDTSNRSMMNALYGGIIKQETGRSASSLGINISGGPNVDGGFATPEYINADTYGLGSIDYGAVPRGTTNFTAEHLKAMDLNGDGETTYAEIKEYRDMQETQTTDGGKNPWSGSSTVKKQNAPNSANIVQATDNQTIQQAITGAQQANATIQAASQTAGTQAAATDATLESVGGWLNWGSSWAADWLVRLLVALLGLILIGGALGLLIWKGSDVLPDTKAN